jgi:hypothetical protein
MMAAEETTMPHVAEFSLWAAAVIATFTFGEALLDRPSKIAVRLARSLAARLRRP